MRRLYPLTHKLGVLTLSLSLLAPQSALAKGGLFSRRPDVTPLEMTSTQNSINLRFQTDIFGKSFATDKDGKSSRFERTNRKKYIANVSEVMVDSVATSRKAARLARKGQSAAAALLSIQDDSEITQTVSDRDYNVNVQGYSKVDKNTILVRVPQRLYDLLNKTDACDLGAVGPCIVVDKDMSGNAEAFMVGSAFMDGSFLIVRKQIRKNIDNRRAINDLLEIENNVMTVYSFAQNQQEVNNKFAEVQKRSESKASNRREDAATSAHTDSDEVAQEEVSIDKGTAKQGKVEVLKSQEEIVLAEKEMGDIAKNWDVSVRQKYEELMKGGSKDGVCVVGGYLETKAIQVLFLRLNFSEKMKFEIPSNDRPLMKGKGRLLCYMNDRSVVRIKIEAKMFSDLSIGAMFGKMYFGSIGIGIANGPLDLIQTRKDDGTLLPYREWAFFPFLNADAAYILGVGASLPGFSGGRHQSPILNIFTGRVGVGAVGARWGIFEKGRIGFDPDDL